MTGRKLRLMTLIDEFTRSPPSLWVRFTATERREGAPLTGLLIKPSIGELFGRIVDLQVLRFPFPIPSVDIKQYWHRSQHGDPGNRWLRSIVMDLFHD